MMVNVYNSSGETEAGVSGVQNQSELHNEILPQTNKTNTKKKASKQTKKQKEHMVGGGQLLHF